MDKLLKDKSKEISSCKMQFLASAAVARDEKERDIEQNTIPAAPNKSYAAAVGREKEEKEPEVPICMLKQNTLPAALHENLYSVNQQTTIPAALDESLYPIKPPSPSACLPQSTILHVPTRPPIQLPVGMGITPLIWSTYELSTKKAMADLFKCNTIGQFEDDHLNLGTTLAESELSPIHTIDSDHALAKEITFQERNSSPLTTAEIEYTMHDGDIAASISVNESR